MSVRPITIKDIARELNISPSTVSRALRKHADISQSTIDAVTKFAEEHNYKPNVLAMSLRTSKSNIIGVIIPQIAHFFFSSVLDGMEKIADENDFSLIICQSKEEYEKEVKIVKTLLSTQVCGILASLSKTTDNYSHFQEVADNGVPLVFFDRICTGILTDRVVVDDYQGAFTAVEHLINSGCKRIAFFGSNPMLEISKNRKNGYLDALRKYKLPIDESLMFICDNYDDARRITPGVLLKENRPDAFFAINDATASGILYSTKKSGFFVPEDISICGFSDGYIAQNTDPALTTVDQSGFDVGTKAMELMINRINGTEESTGLSSRIVKTKLIVREPTR